MSNIWVVHPPLPHHGTAPLTRVFLNNMIICTHQQSKDSMCANMCQYVHLRKGFLMFYNLCMIFMMVFFCYYFLLSSVPSKISLSLLFQLQIVCQRYLTSSGDSGGEIHSAQDSWEHSSTLFRASLELFWSVSLGLPKVITQLPKIG